MGKIKNKPFRYVIAVLSILSMLLFGSVCAFAADSPEPENTNLSDDVIASGECGANLTWTLDTNGTLKISGTGDMYDYGFSREDRAAWFALKDNIVALEIEEGVTSIGECAFMEMTIGNPIIPNSITSIGEYAFTLTEIERITIPENVTSIGQNCFWQCSNLSKVIIECEDVSFEPHLFYLCPKLNTAGPIGSGCDIEFCWTKKIPDNALYASEIKDVIIPDGITYIGKTAFWYTDLQEITIPHSVQNIGQGAFPRDRMLKSIYIDKAENIMSESSWNVAPDIEIIYLREINVQHDSDRFTYTGKRVKPKLVITEDRIDGTASYELLEDTDYILTYLDNINLGTATLNLKYINNYLNLGKESMNFEIVPKSGEDLSINPIPDQAYTGQEIQPMPVIINN